MLDHLWGLRAIRCSWSHLSATVLGVCIYSGSRFQLSGVSLVAVQGSPFRSSRHTYLGFFTAPYLAPGSLVLSHAVYTCCEIFSMCSPSTMTCIFMPTLPVALLALGLNGFGRATAHASTVLYRPCIRYSMGALFWIWISSLLAYLPSFSGLSGLWRTFSRRRRCYCYSLCGNQTHLQGRAYQ